MSGWYATFVAFIIRGLSPADDSYNISLHSSQGSLPTHKEEPEDYQSPPQPSIAWLDGNMDEVWSGQISALPSEHRVCSLSENLFLLHIYFFSFFLACIGELSYFLWVLLFWLALMRGYSLVHHMKIVVYLYL